MADSTTRCDVQELFQYTGITATAARKQALVDGLGNATEKKKQKKPGRVLRKWLTELS